MNNDIIYPVVRGHFKKKAGMLIISPGFANYGSLRPPTEVI